MADNNPVTYQLTSQSDAPCSQSDAPCGYFGHFVKRLRKTKLVKYLQRRKALAKFPKALRKATLHYIKNGLTQCKLHVVKENKLSIFFDVVQVFRAGETPDKGIEL